MPIQSILWKKPRRVVVENGRLVADFVGSGSYPLLDALKKERALRAFTKVRTDDDAVTFTETWGLLSYRLENGQWNTFPLDRFHLERCLLLDLAGLTDAMRTGDIVQVAEALRAYGRTRRDLTIGSDCWEADLTEKEKVLVSEGRAPMDVFIARHTGRLPSLSDYAAQVLANELHQPERLRFVRENRQSRLEEVRELTTLKEAIWWTLRSRHNVLYRIVCASCGNDAVVGRADGVYCSETCGTRARVQRYRGKKLNVSDRLSLLSAGS